MTRGLRGVWRLARATLHVCHGFVIVVFRFRAFDDARRQARVQWWSAKLIRLLGIDLRVEGELSGDGTLLVANHVSWLDISTLHAVAPRARFVSKADIRRWPLVSRLADAAGTLYLERDRKRDALRVVHLVAEALKAGQTVAVFPEGTTSDGRDLLPFHANLLQAAVSSASPVQPVALWFSDAHERLSTAVEFVGETTMARSVWRVACADALVAHLALLPVRATQGVDRRVLAQILRADIVARIHA